MKAAEGGCPTKREGVALQSECWRRVEKGSGILSPENGALRFRLAEAASAGYANAQIDDYHGLPRRGFAWRPPLHLTVRARFSHLPAGMEGTSRTERPLVGTAGFGFWNDPFLMTEPRLPALPRALWFFYASPPSNMKLDLHVPGFGWKAAMIEARWPAALCLAPLALPTMLLMNVPSLHRALWPPIQRRLKIAEALLDVDTREWHSYHLEWGMEQATFHVTAPGGAPRKALAAPAPRGPLGFVMWMDNQYLVATPWGRLGWGVLGISGEQWMEVDHLVIENLR